MELNKCILFIFFLFEKMIMKRKKRRDKNKGREEANAKERSPPTMV